MIILKLKQGTDAWLAFRLENFMASEAAAMMGESPYMSRNELLDLKKTGIAKPVSASKQRLFDKGHATEEKARPIAESLLSDDDGEFYPVTGLLENDKVGASFDGLTMMQDIAFEHKLYNKVLAENVKNNTLGPAHYWQLEQQLLVSDAEKVLFVTSDGTEENFEHMYYVSVPERRADLIAGWKQFAIDLENHEVKVKAEKLVAKEIEALPKLEISLVGNVSASNLVVYKSTALTFIENISADLVTDQDFVDAEKAVKFCQNGEKELDEVKKRALSDTADIAALFETIDELKESMRQKRLTLDKLVKLRKAEIKTEIKAKAVNEFNALVSIVNAKIGAQVATTVADFDGAMKGKRTIESLQNAIDSELARVKIELTQTGELIDANLAALIAHASNHKFLFNDFAQLVLKPTEDLTNLIKMRISEHEQVEDERKRIEKEQIEKAAQEKAEAEEERIRSEERAKAQAEQAVIAQQQAEANHKAMEAAQARAITQQPESHSIADIIIAEEAVREVVAKQESQTSVGKEADPIQEEAPIEHRLTKRFQSVPANGKAEMMQQLKFWKNEYGVRDSEFTDLLRIINQHAYCDDQESNAA